MIVPLDLLEYGEGRRQRPREIEKNYFLLFILIYTKFLRVKGFTYALLNLPLTDKGVLKE